MLSIDGLPSEAGQALYHFTLPCRLPGIFSTGGLEPSATVQHGFMSGGVPVVWLTTDPRGNEIDRATIRHFRKLGMDDLLAEIESGRRLMFGADKADGDGSARIALRLPKQAQRDGAVLRLACCLATERGIEVCAPVHDAVLICAPLSRLEQDVVAMQAAFAEASRAVLDGFELRSEAKIVRWPDRYSDVRGRRMWQETIGLVEKAEASRRETAYAR